MSESVKVSKGYISRLLTLAHAVDESETETEYGDSVQRLIGYILALENTTLEIAK